MSNVPDLAHHGTSQGAISGIKRCWEEASGASSGGHIHNLFTSCISSPFGSNIIPPIFTVAGNEEAYYCRKFIYLINAFQHIYYICPLQIDLKSK